MEAAPPEAPPPRAVCPVCGGALSEPISGAVHCYRQCEACGEEYQLDDPRLA
jgi:uncharacterized protein (DUF983 family)